MTRPELLTRAMIHQDGRTLTYAMAGQAGAELVVLAAHYRVAAIDLPGHGLGQRPDTTTRIVDTAGLVAALLAQEGYQRAHLVGVSLGALVAQDIAARFPSTVSSLTVAGGYSIFGPSPAIQQGFTRRSLRAFAGNDALLRASFQLSAAPLQIVVGEHERPLLRSVAEEWQRREPGSVLEVIPGAGHCANMDNPGVFNERLLAFLEANRPFPGQPRGHVPVLATVE